MASSFEGCATANVAVPVLRLHVSARARIYTRENPGRTGRARRVNNCDRQAEMAVANKRNGGRNPLRSGDLGPDHLTNGTLATVICDPHRGLPGRIPGGLT